LSLPKGAKFLFVRLSSMDLLFRLDREGLRCAAIDKLML
jgi:hypothetical protein